MSSTRLARTALIQKSEADRLMAAYFKLFPGVVMWLERARQVGFSMLRSRTLLGRTRPVPATEGTGPALVGRSAGVPASEGSDRAAER